VAPVVFDVKSILMNCSKVVVEPNVSASSSGTEIISGSSEGVSLRSHIFESGVTSRPVLRGKTDLKVYWPGSESFPWTEFSARPPRGLPDGFYEAFQRLRRILLPFKSDKYGELGKYKKFVDGSRRIKGSGKKVRDQLIDEGIIRAKDYVYLLSLERLKDQTGLNYQRMRDYEIPDAAVEFLRRALERAD
jgi:hypothetical protein